MRVYLAGSKGDWRKKVVSAVSFQIIDPFKDSRQGSISEFTSDDLGWIDSCDAVFCYTDYHTYTGSALELGYAKALGKPIVYATALPRIDSMMVGVASAAFTDLDAAIEYVKERWVA